MSYENPTPLRVGATGTLNGWRVRVAGRVVMGMEVDGETYYWNEFNLVDPSGNAATLVHEETEEGPEWKVFREFTPTHPLSAREAAAKSVGDRVNLDGTPVAITLVDESRVYHIEGEPPEGVEVGDVARYFNADTGNRMLVASWTGDDIQFFEGLDAPADQVADAFGFPRAGVSGATAASLFRGSAEDRSGGSAGSSSSLTKWVLIVLGLASAIGAYACFAGGRTRRPATVAPAAKQAAPAQRLANGSRGPLAQHTYQITGQLLAEVSRAGSRFDRREYFLRDETGAPALLINGLSGGSKEWHLFLPAPTPNDLTPYDAARKRRNSPVSVDGHAAQVTDLFQWKPLSTEGAAADSAPLGSEQYGFVARDAADWLVARWTEDRIQLYRGRALTDSEVLTAFSPKPAAK